MEDRNESREKAFRDHDLSQWPDSDQNFTQADLTTPGIRYAIAAVFVISLIVYLNMHYFLFFSISIGPIWGKFVHDLSLGIAIISGLMLMTFILVNSVIALQRWNYNRKQPEKFMICAKCGKINTLTRYQNQRTCTRCGSSNVVCADCGNGVEFTYFFTGVGCPYCGSMRYHTKEKKKKRTPIND